MDTFNGPIPTITRVPPVFVAYIPNDIHKFTFTLEGKSKKEEKCEVQKSSLSDVVLFFAAD